MIRKNAGYPLLETLAFEESQLMRLEQIRAQKQRSVVLRVLRILANTVAATSLFLVFILTCLLHIWRATDPAWLLPCLMVTELLLFVAGGIWGRRYLNALVGDIHTISLGIPPRVRWALLLSPILSLLVISAFTASADDKFPDHTKAAKQRRIAVVGAGAAGVHAAWMLKQAGDDFTVYEAADYVGGHARSVPFKPMTMKSTPSSSASFLAQPMATQSSACWLNGTISSAIVLG